MSDPLTPALTPEVATDVRVLERFAQQVSDQVYTDPEGARRLVVQFGDLVREGGEDAGLEARRLALLGNLANQAYDFESAEDLLRQAQALAAQTGVSRLVVELAADLAGPLLNLERVTEAAATIDDALALLEESRPDTPDVAAERWRLRTREGFLRLRLGALEEALRSFNEAKEHMPGPYEVASRGRDAYYAALLHAGMGRVYAAGGDNDRSIEAYADVVATCARANMRGRLPYHYLDLGRALMAAERREEASANFERAIAEAGERDRHARASAAANLGYYAYVDEDYARAKNRFDEAEHHYVASGRPADADLSTVNLWRARVAQAERDDPAAERALAKALEHARAAEDFHQLASVYQEISDYYAERKAYEDAYDFRLRFEDARHEALENDHDERLSELELRHEVEERRREGELFRLKAARLQLKALRAQMNPHFIFNALNAIQEVITSDRATEAAGHLAHFARLMRQSLDYSEREAITLEEEVDFLRNYLDLNRALRYSEPFEYEITVGDDLEDDLIGLPAMLVQPYVENALEHGIRLVERGRVRIAFTSPPDDEDALRIVIEDNGVGREKAGARKALTKQAHRSMGTEITKNRLELLNRDKDTSTTVAYEDLRDGAGEPAGTRVTIELPILWQA